MNCKHFIGRSDLLIGAGMLAPLMVSKAFSDPMLRIGLTTYVFRNRFRSKNY